MSTLIKNDKIVPDSLCYKAEMEAALRTRGMAGFQLLDLQDYPGQGTALVGILDAFMDSKNVVTPEVWRQSCNDVVLLPEFQKYCWTNIETFKSELLVSNYSQSDLEGEIQWQITDDKNTVLNKGVFTVLHIVQGDLTTAGTIAVNLKSTSKAQKLTFSCSITGTGYSNEYPIWVYPETEIERPQDIVISEQLNSKTLHDLKNGASVLLMPQTEDVKENSLPGLFHPDFWNYGMFKMISGWNNKPVSPGTLGLYMDPEHPVFNDFPTDFHTNWQWFSIIKNSRSLILDSLSQDYYPIIQVIDNIERNHKLGLLFEFKVGEGKLLVCMAQLNKITDKPEARQLLGSIYQYMEGSDFNPEYEVGGEELMGLFR